MKLFKNANTEEYFIYVDNEGENNIILVTPGYDVKAFKRSLFEESGEGDEQDFVSRGFVSEMQVKTYWKEMSRRTFEREIAKRQASWDVSDKMTDKQKVGKILAEVKKLPASKRQKAKEILYSWITQNETS